MPLATHVPDNEALAFDEKLEEARLAVQAMVEAAPRSVCEKIFALWDIEVSFDIVSCDICR